MIVHRDVDSQKGKDKKHDNREVFGIWLQEYRPGWEDLLPVQRLRALVVLRSRYRGEAVRVQEGIPASVGCSRRSRGDSNLRYGPMGFPASSLIFPR